MIHYNTREDNNKMKQYLKERKINLIDDLIKNKNFDVNAPLNNLNQPPLFHFVHMILTHVFIGNVDFEIIKLLVESKADVNYISNGFNVLTLMYKHNISILKTTNIIKLLLVNKANHISSIKNNALEYAINSSLWLYNTSTEHLKCSYSIEPLKLLLKYGVTFNESIFNCYSDHFSNHRINTTKLLLDNVCPSTNSSLKHMFTNINSLQRVCNLGCLTAVKQLITNDSHIDKVYKRVILYGTEEILHNVSLLEIVLRHIDILNSPKSDSAQYNFNDLDNYVEIATLLINYGANTNKILPGTPLRNIVIVRNDTIKAHLLDYVPKVLVNIIMDYY
jgi:hypothetical protein